MAGRVNNFLMSLRWLSPSKREDFFLKRIKESKVPRHVAVIMDGNGRWAKERGLPRLAGHRAGTETTRRIVQAARRVGVKYLTLYTFSVENWQRPREEIKGLMELFEEMISKEIEELSRNEVRVNIVGNISQLPKTTQEACLKAMEKTKNNDKLNLNIALNYGGRTELVDAVRKIAKKVEEGKIRSDEIEQETIGKHLLTVGIPDPELLIRTSGELRVSNFLLWQIAYTELWVTPTLWPNFTKDQFYQAIYEFQQRKRRFGKVEQTD